MTDLAFPLVGFTGRSYGLYFAPSTAFFISPGALDKGLILPEPRIIPHKTEVTDRSVVTQAVWLQGKTVTGVRFTGPVFYESCTFVQCDFSGSPGLLQTDNNPCTFTDCARPVYQTFDRVNLFFKQSDEPTSGLNLWPKYEVQQGEVPENGASVAERIIRNRVLKNCHVMNSTLINCLILGPSVVVNTHCVKTRFSSKVKRRAVTGKFKVVQTKRERERAWEPQYDISIAGHLHRQKRKAFAAAFRSGFDFVRLAGPENFSENEKIVLLDKQGRFSGLPRNPLLASRSSRLNVWLTDGPTQIQVLARPQQNVAALYRDGVTDECLENWSAYIERCADCGERCFDSVEFDRFSRHRAICEACQQGLDDQDEDERPEKYRLYSYHGAPRTHFRVPRQIPDGDFVVGMELEVEIHHDGSKQENLRHTVDHLDPIQTVVESDSSLRYGYEVITEPTLFSVLHAKLSTLGKKKIAPDVRNDPTSSDYHAGIHIHLSPLSKQKAWVITAALVKDRQLVEKLARRKSNSWCIYPEILEQFGEFDPDSRHYAALHRVSGQHYELRLWRGTSVWYKVRESLDLCKNLVDYAKVCEPFVLQSSTAPIITFAEFLAGGRPVVHTEVVAQRETETAQEEIPF